MVSEILPIDVVETEDWQLVGCREERGKVQKRKASALTQRSDAPLRIKKIFKAGGPQCLLVLVCVWRYLNGTAKCHDGKPGATIFHFVMHLRDQSLRHAPRFFPHFVSRLVVNAIFETRLG